MDCVVVRERVRGSLLPLHNYKGLHGEKAKAVDLFQEASLLNIFYGCTENILNTRVFVVLSVWKVFVGMITMNTRAQTR